MLPTSPPRVPLSPTDSAAPPPGGLRRRLTPALRAFPGLAIAFAAAGLALALARVVPLASPALTTVVLGILAANLGLVPDAARPGLAIAAKPVLRIGIVLLGFQLALGDIIQLGPLVIVIIVAVVTGGIGAGLLTGRALRIPATDTILISCGFSICGAAAVAAATGALDTYGSDEEGKRKRAELEAQTAVAVTLVVVFGTLMIGLVPFASAALGLADFPAGVFAGGSIHEVAQVVAAGSIIGSGALAVAVLVKLGRVVLLAPMIAVITASRRGGSSGSGARPPLVPLFVVGFLAAIAIRTTGVLPMPVIDAIAPIQVVFLAAAMLALGTGAKFSQVKQVGTRPLILAVVVTIVVASIALGGAALIA